MLPTGNQKWTIIATTLVGAFVFSLNGRGSVLEAPVIVQAFALDRYKIQWITGAEAVAGLTALLASVYLMRGQYKQAQAVLDDAVHADPSNPEAYGNRATLFLALLAEAESAARRPTPR